MRWLHCLFAVDEDFAAGFANRDKLEGLVDLRAKAKAEVSWPSSAALGDPVARGSSTKASYLSQGVAGTNSGSEDPLFGGLQDALHRVHHHWRILKCIVAPVKPHGSHILHEQQVGRNLRRQAPSLVTVPPSSPSQAPTGCHVVPTDLWYRSSCKSNHDNAPFPVDAPKAFVEHIAADALKDDVCALPTCVLFDFRPAAAE